MILVPLCAAAPCKEYMAWFKLCRASARPSVGICQPCSTFNCYLQRWRTESSVNYYDVLGLRPNASQSQIKSAYYQLSKLYHPDTARNLPNSKEIFARLSVAYEVLGNPHKRALYDRERSSVVGDDRDYGDFLQRRGSFSSRHGATASSARNPGVEFDKFYKEHYAQSLRYNWEAKRSSDYKQRRTETQRSPESISGSTMAGLVITACMLFVLLLIK